MFQYIALAEDKEYPDSMLLANIEQAPNTTATALRRLLMILALPATIAALPYPVPAQASKDEWKPQNKVIEAWSQKRTEHNFYESRVPEYKLPNPLVSKSGSPISNARDWTAKRRPELLQLFRENVYGVRPSTEYEIAYEEIGLRKNAFGIGATVQQIRATIQARGKALSFDFVFATPHSETAVPVIVQINNRYFIPLDKAADEFDPFWPVEKLLRRGYATASFHTSHVDPDDKRNGYEAGIRALMDDPESDPETRWKSLSAWGVGSEPRIGLRSPTSGDRFRTNRCRRTLPRRQGCSLGRS